MKDRQIVPAWHLHPTGARIASRTSTQWYNWKNNRERSRRQNSTGRNLFDENFTGNTLANENFTGKNKKRFEPVKISSQISIDKIHSDSFSSQTIAIFTVVKTTELCFCLQNLCYKEAIPNKNTWKVNVKLISKGIDYYTFIS